MITCSPEQNLLASRAATTEDNTAFTLNITPTGEGDVSLDVPAAVAEDLAGNLNVASAQVVVSNQIVEITQGVIANFMLNRSNFLLANQPDLSSLFNGSHASGGGWLWALSLNSDLDNLNVAFASSLSRIDKERQRNAKLPLFETARGDGDANRHDIATIGDGHEYPLDIPTGGPTVGLNPAEAATVAAEQSEQADSSSPPALTWLRSLDRNLWSDHVVRRF